MREIPMANGRGVAIVDDEDFPRLFGYMWYLSTSGYANAFKGTRKINERIAMHRLIVQAVPGEYVDHINGNKLDNRKANLRKCDQSGNLANTSMPRTNTTGFKGVSWDKARGKFVAQIKVRGKHIHLGRFADKTAAARAYDRAARQWFGDFARTNFQENA